MNAKGIIQEEINIATAELKHLNSRLRKMSVNTDYFMDIDSHKRQIEYHLVRLRVMERKLQYFSKREFEDAIERLNTPKFIATRVKWLWKNRERIHFGWWGVSYRDDRRVLNSPSY